MSTDRASDKCRFELSADGKFQQMSEEFSALVGFAEGALLGLPISCVTAPYTVHIAQILGVVSHLGCFHCLWLFVHREGRAILVRTDWTLLPGKLIEGSCEPLPVFE